MRCTSKETEQRLRGLFAAHFGETSGPFVLASAPGRVELAGNHTDHQGGRTLSAAIGQRAHALAAPNGSDAIRVFMDGFGEGVVRLAELDARARERGGSLALVRGMAAAYAQAGGELRGFDMVTCSDIPVGCGVSSSAAFEMLMGVTVRAVCEPTPKAAFDPVALALQGQWAEDVYFGKPTGAQDQLASACGGVVALDFADEVPRVEPVVFDLAACGYEAFLVDSRCDHSRHTDEFNAIPADMFAVARHFGCERLEDVPYDAFLGQLADARSALGDRAVLRALHYFEETRRVQAQQRALEAGDFAEFLRLVRASGASSAQFLQNVSPRGDGSGADQPAAVVLALCASLLDGAGDGAGACRIHGGGFGGSVLAFVPNGRVAAFRARLDKLLGYEACLPVKISPQGACAERIV